MERKFEKKAQTGFEPAIFEIHNASVMFGNVRFEEGIFGSDFEFPLIYLFISYRTVFTWLLKAIGFGIGFGFTTPFGWLVYLLWFWFYDSQVKTALIIKFDTLPYCYSTK